MSNSAKAGGVDTGALALDIAYTHTPAAWARFIGRSRSTSLPTKLLGRTPSWDARQVLRPGMAAPCLPTGAILARGPAGAEPRPRRAQAPNCTHHQRRPHPPRASRARSPGGVARGRARSGMAEGREPRLRPIGFWAATVHWGAADMAAALSTGALRVPTASKAATARRLRDWNGPLGGCARLLLPKSGADAPPGAIEAAGTSSEAALGKRCWSGAAAVS